MIVCGMDEVGRGSLAGPLVAAATILSPQPTMLKLNDSKKLTTKQRFKIYNRIKRSGAVIAIEEISARQINSREWGGPTKKF